MRKQPQVTTNKYLHLGTSWQYASFIIVLHCLTYCYWLWRGSSDPAISSPVVDEGRIKDKATVFLSVLWHLLVGWHLPCKKLSLIPGQERKPRGAGWPSFICWAVSVYFYSDEEIFVFLLSSLYHFTALWAEPAGQSVQNNIQDLSKKGLLQGLQQQ